MHHAAERNREPAVLGLIVLHFSLTPAALVGRLHGHAPPAEAGGHGDREQRSGAKHGREGDQRDAGARTEKPFRHAQHRIADDAAQPAGQWP
jgi:hypothetical protein